MRMSGNPFHILVLELVLSDDRLVTYGKMPIEDLSRYFLSTSGGQNERPPRGLVNHVQIST